MIINMNGAKAPETPSPVLQEKTVTPETLPTVIGADEGYDGLSQVTVNPDAQLKAENIRSGKTIFGVTGAFVGEPQPIEELDITKVTGRAGYYSFLSPLAFTLPSWIAAVKLTELDFEKDDSVSDTESPVIGYANGAIGCNRYGGTPTLNPNTLAHASGANYYKVSKTFEGEVEMAIPGSVYTTDLGLGEPYPSHIKGTLFIIAGMIRSTSNTPGEMVYIPSVSRSCGYGDSVLEMEVDSPITFVKGSTASDDRLTFKINVPRIESTITGYTYSTSKYVSLVLTALPKKIVIS